MTKEFDLEIRGVRTRITATLDEAAQKLVVERDGVPAGEKNVCWTLNAMFMPVVIDEETVLFLCLERRFPNRLKAMIHKDPTFSFDLFVDGKSVLDGSPMTRGKDEAEATLDRGFGKFLLKKIGWALIPAVVIVALLEVIFLSTDHFNPYNYGFVDAALNLAQVAVIALFFVGVAWYCVARRVEKWDGQFRS